LLGSGIQKLKAPWRGELKIAASLSWGITRTLLSASSKQAPIALLDVDAHPANVGRHSYVRTNGMESYRLLFRPNRYQLWRGVCHSLITVLAYAFQRNTVKAQWQKGVAALKTPERWAALFSAARA
jgi:hypothetical protein